MSTLLKNPRTTIVAVLGALVILMNQVLAVIDNNPETVFDLNTVFEALTILGIGIFARDSNVTSEQAGAK